MDAAEQSGPPRTSGEPLRLRGDYHCMARIAFRLRDHGVRLIHFVDPSRDR